jgi:hypothetical protein
MATLEKLLGARFYSTIMGHLACHQVTLPTFLRGGLAFP